MANGFAQLLVHLDATQQAAQRLKVARQIAHAQDAAVTALYAVTPGFVDLPFAPVAGPDISAALRDIDDELLARARAAFDQTLVTPGAPAAWAVVAEAPIMAAFAQQALYADLLVMGQHDPDSAALCRVPSDFVESVMLASGKPVLVLPYTGALPQTVGDTVVIAWKPSREAARAVSSAMPLLRRARRVIVLSWTGEDERIEGSRLDLAGYLKLCGVQASWHSQGAEPEALGELLLSHAFDLEADLLVMGCYGHSRAREWVLGGTSRTVLRSMTLPVLMVH
ncbi:MAG: universal stress protein [Polaromonas sp.]